MTSHRSPRTVTLLLCFGFDPKKGYVRAQPALFSELTSSLFCDIISIDRRSVYKQKGKPCAL